jgi:acyl-CoA thioesterase
MPMPRLEHLAPFTKLLGLNISRVEEGYCQGVIEVDEKLQNVHETMHGGVVRIMHGGVISTLADTCMAIALSSSLDENELPRTLEMKISYFVAVTSGVLTCESKIIHKGGTVAALESEITNDGRLIAKATATFGIVKAKGD